MKTVIVVKPIIHLFPLGPCPAGVFFRNTRNRKKTMTQIKWLLEDHFRSKTKLLELLGLDGYDLNIEDCIGCYWRFNLYYGNSILYNENREQVVTHTQCKSIEVKRQDINLFHKSDANSAYLFVLESLPDSTIDTLYVFDKEKEVKDE